MERVERVFKVKGPSGRIYEVVGNENTTSFSVWSSQKCWFSHGAIVEIIDDDGNKETFMKM